MKVKFTKEETKDLRLAPHVVDNPNVDRCVNSPLDPVRTLRMIICRDVLGETLAAVAEKEGLDRGGVSRSVKRWRDWARKQAPYRRIVKEVKAKKAA